MPEYLFMIFFFLYHIEFYTPTVVQWNHHRNTFYFSLLKNTKYRDWICMNSLSFKLFSVFTRMEKVMHLKINTKTYINTRDYITCTRNVMKGRLHCASDPWLPASCYFLVMNTIWFQEHLPIGLFLPSLPPRIQYNLVLLNLAKWKVLAIYIWRKMLTHMVG